MSVNFGDLSMYQPEDEELPTLPRYVPAACLCIDKHPSTQSVLFGDQFVKLRIVAEQTGLSWGYVSKIFSGKRSLSMRAARLIAPVLDMELGEFIGALDEHTKYK